MNALGHRGGALLLGLATGAALMAGVATAAPGIVVPASRQAALGTRTDPTAVRSEVALPTVAATTLLPAPQPTTTPRTTTAVPTPTSTPRPTATPTTTPQARPTTPAPTVTPEATPTREPDPALSAHRSGLAEAVVAATNAERARAGCAALVTDPRLTAAAQAHSTDMAENHYFSHTSRDGRTVADRVSDAGYPSPGGENIAYGQPDAASVMVDWMDSPGHRRNIENCSFTAIGVGYDERGRYWTQDFGR